MCTELILLVIFCTGETEGLDKAEIIYLSPLRHQLAQVLIINTHTVSYTAICIISYISAACVYIISSPSLVPHTPLELEGEPVGSNGILLSWTMPHDARNIDGYVIR